MTLDPQDRFNLEWGLTLAGAMLIATLLFAAMRWLLQ